MGRRVANLAGWVIVVLLPKLGGGRRSIGLIPALPRIWSRASRHVAVEWRSANARTYLYGGAGMGEDVVAWKQAPRPEYTAANRKCFA